ncbi:hypothetical protein [Metabacillus bambusae]|uniref:Uncharacterized protein n=1 Tax=Metabacillus bambusae TaxID=2795218 RepID=A0ABS3MZY6_9BACI|nr:hypothetical protein [Metabacillus bambusae]MBO1511545.1 hypothetical protein [Metabacillus bambusae]
MKKNEKKDYSFDAIYDRAFERYEKKRAFRESLKAENLPENSWLKAEDKKVTEEPKEEKFHEGKTFEEFYADFCKKHGTDLGDDK